MITIHCGLHKTGSSSIQLALERCFTRGRTIVTPKPGDDRSEHGWRERLSKIAAAQHSIFSDENLLGSPYDGYQLAPVRIAMLREALHGVPYQIVVYLRPHVDWLPSVYLQGVQEGKTISTVDFWNSIKDEPYLRWSNLLHLLGSESGAEQVHARVHTGSRDAVADCFEFIGLGKPPRTGPTMIRENASIAAVQAPLLRQLNDLHGVDDAQRKQLRTVFQRDLALGADKTRSPFPLSVQSEIAAHLRSDWSAVIADAFAVDDLEEMQEALKRYDVGPAPYAGGSFEDVCIQTEALRSLRLLSLGYGVQRRSTLRRILEKSLHDPLSLPSAMTRRWRR